MLQQYLPFTVLKHDEEGQYVFFNKGLLEQYLPFTVLKLTNECTNHVRDIRVATVLTVYGIETPTNSS